MFVLTCNTIAQKRSTAMQSQIKALVVVEVSHVVRRRIDECRRMNGYEARIVECEREKIVVEMNRTFQDKFKRSSTLFGLRVERSKNIVIPLLVSKWDDSEGKIAFDVHSSDVYSSLRDVKSVYMIRPLEILTSYRRMYSCNINGLMNRSPRLVQALLGRPPPKHIFFGDEDVVVTEKDETEDLKENVNGRSRGGSFGEWCALAKNIKQHRRDREEDKIEKIEREEKKIKREKEKTKNVEKQTSLLNTSQRNAISCFLNDNEPLCMIHGPPGTGKTKTIIGMLEMLLLCGHVKSDLRIVVCAPSNKAVYVLLRAYNAKVMSLKKSSSSSSVKPLLVGVEDNLPSDLRPYVTHSLTHITITTTNIHKHRYFVHDAKRHFNSDVSNIKTSLQNAANNNNAERHLKSASETLNELRLKLTSRCPETSKVLRRTVTLLANHLKSFQYRGGLNDFLKLREFQDIAKKLRNDVNDLNEFDLEREWTSRSQLVFCTLACSGRDMLCRRKPCDFLIIDEAAQAVEAECLVAFQLRPRRVLFVGDPNQLSAMAQSDVARRAGYERSTMQRLREDSSVTCNLLRTQYRMNPEISSFPNSQFYENRIVDSDSVCLRSRRFRVLSSSSTIFPSDVACRLVEMKSSILNPYVVFERGVNHFTFSCFNYISLKLQECQLVSLTHRHKKIT